MTEPFYKASPGDPIVADKWNDMQVKMRDELSARISAHTHSGGAEGKKLTGDGIDPTSILKVNQLDAAVSLSVKNIDVLDRLNTLNAQKLALTGGNITGSLTVSGNIGIGTTNPNKKLTVDYTGSATNHAVMELRNPGNAAWGVALVVRTTYGADGAGILFRNRAKSWLFRGEVGATATGFQIAEDGGDAEYGSGPGTPRVHLSAGGAVGIGTTTPSARLDVKGATKDNTASVFRVTNSEGAPLLEVRNDGAIFGGPNLLSATGRRILETNPTDDWLRINPQSDYKSIALNKPVAIGSGGLAIGDWSQLDKGSVKATGTIHTEQDLVLGANANNKKFTLHSRSATSGDYLHITSDRTTGEWDWANGIVLKRGGNVGIGTTDPNKKLTINYTDSGQDHAVMELRNPGDRAWGIGLVVRTTGGTYGAGILFRSRKKSWQIRGTDGENGSGLQITENGGDAEYGGDTGTSRLHISPGGYVGINAIPSAVLEVKGNHESMIKVMSPSYNVPVLDVRASGHLVSLFDLSIRSDLRTKRDITPLEDSLEKVLKLRGTRFRMVESKDESQRIGLIAQEVEEVFPEVVDAGADGMKGINYSQLVAPLIEAIKSQQKQLDELRSALRTATQENPT